MPDSHHGAVGRDLGALSVAWDGSSGGSSLRIDVCCLAANSDACIAPKPAKPRTRASRTTVAAEAPVHRASCRALSRLASSGCSSRNSATCFCFAERRSKRWRTSRPIAEFGSSAIGGVADRCRSLQIDTPTQITRRLRRRKQAVGAFCGGPWPFAEARGHHGNASQRQHTTQMLRIGGIRLLSTMPTADAVPSAGGDDPHHCYARGDMATPAPTGKALPRRRLAPKVARRGLQCACNPVATARLPAEAAAVGSSALAP